MPATTSRIDWLSFTMPVLNVGVQPKWRALSLSVQIAEYTGGILMPDEESVCAGRPPYTWSISCEGCRVFFAEQGDALVEISGRGCEALHEAGALRAIVSAWKDRITRLDHATDIETSVTPTQFTAKVARKPKSTSVIRSKTGETVYIGSMKSDRYARVYRYAPPHPRAAWLRCEHVFRKNDAKAVARLWLDIGDDALAANCGATFGWLHHAWTPQNGEKIKKWKPEKRNANLCRWLAVQVVPALSNGLVSGQIDPEWLATTLRARIPQTHLNRLANLLKSNDARSADHE